MAGKSTNKVVGNLGEDMAARFLEKKGFVIKERNYRRRFGEIDIIAQKRGVIHFVEVKSVSRENTGYRPEELVYPEKLLKIRKTGEFYLVSCGTPDVEAQVDVVTVRLNTEKRLAHCEYIGNVL